MAASFPIRRAGDLAVARSRRCDRLDRVAYFGRMATPATLIDAATGASDQELMLGYANGDAAAFDALYARHKSGVYRYLLRHCGAGVADELFQDVWMSVVRSRASYAPTAKFTTWLYRIAHNRVIDHWRAKGEHVALDDAQEVDIAAAPRTLEPQVRAQSRELRDRLDAAVRALPPLQRDAFLLHEEGGLSLAEIAALTDSPVETVKSRLRYASHRLRTQLEDLR